MIFSASRLPALAHEKLSGIIDSSPKISIINKIELLGFSVVPSQIIAFCEVAFVIPLDEEIAIQTIAIRKKHKIKLADAVIAASAIVSNLILITHNMIDFKKIVGLKFVDSYLLGPK